MDITKKITSFETACEDQGLNPSDLPIVNHLPEWMQQSIIDYYKLSVIVRSLNEGWVPNFHDWNEDKYFNFFYASYGAGAGVGYVASSYVPSLTGTHVGSRLCFKNRKLAVYAAEKFEALYKSYILLS